jgi:hypothetical protein
MLRENARLSKHGPTNRSTNQKRDHLLEVFGAIRRGVIVLLLIGEPNCTPLIIAQYKCSWLGVAQIGSDPSFLGSNAGSSEEAALELGKFVRLGKFVVVPSSALVSKGTS